MSGGYDFSQIYHASIVSYSPGTTFLATVFQNRVIIRSTSTLQIVRTWACAKSQGLASSSRDIDDQVKIDSVEWSEDGLHILVFSAVSHSAWVFGLASDGDGESGEVARIGGQGVDGLVMVEWGRTGKQVLAWSEHGLKLAIYDLSTGVTRIIQNPKSHHHCHSYSPDNRFLAIVEKHLGKEYVGVYDVLDGYLLIRHILLSTIDVQGLSWSPCGRYFAIWDSPLSYSIHIHSPLGPLLTHLSNSSPTFSPNSTTEDPGLGIRTVAWAPRGKWIALGGWDGKVRIIESEGWRCIAVMNWGNRTSDREATIWREPNDWLADTRGRGIVQFDRTLSPGLLPTTRPDLSKANPRAGVSHMSFDKDGALILVRLESSPNVVHIHTFLETPTSETPIITHLTSLVFTSPVRSTRWCPVSEGKSRRLAVTTRVAAIYLWDEEGGWMEENTDGEAVDENRRGGTIEGVAIPSRSDFSALDLHWAHDGSSLAIQDKSQFCLLYDGDQENEEKSLRMDGTDEGLSHVMEEDEDEEGWSGYGLQLREGLRGGYVNAIRA
ncbi:uncharacterized protein IL334_002974 [Kwoniella shivajii]|uniref:Anaphase-promoting complex subunit 4 WD40 domain-containing protein n=1 Tax=Kwoniella shivajii TaxID=564305 RepID=A0ABZ1CW79_9TREE|nr:hypothetical protein IL334_002974 [Kwoniella shivajii]